MVWKASSSDSCAFSVVVVVAAAVAEELVPVTPALGFLSISTVSDERALYCQTPIPLACKSRLAISTMLMSLLAHLDWAWRITRGGLAGGVGVVAVIVGVLRSSGVEVLLVPVESLDITAVAREEIWVLDWIWRWVGVWVWARDFESKAIFCAG